MLKRQPSGERTYSYAEVINPVFNNDRNKFTSSIPLTTNTAYGSSAASPQLDKEEAFSRNSMLINYLYEASQERQTQSNEKLTDTPTNY